MQTMKWVLAVLFIAVLSACQPGQPNPYNPNINLPDNNSRIADHTVVQALWQGKIPESAFVQAKERLRIGYGHRSHGNQLRWGMRNIIGFSNNGNLGTAYSQNLFAATEDGSQIAGSLAILHGEQDGDPNSDPLVGSIEDGLMQQFVNSTRAFLAKPANANYNVIMWAWCSSLPAISADGLASAYLAAMSAMEADFPNVSFVYMTGHLDGTGSAGALHQRNEQIRAYCRQNNKWLYDFADIERYDPAGVDYLDKLTDDSSNWDANLDGELSADGSDPRKPLNGDKNWAQDWQSAHQVGQNWFIANGDMAHAYDINVNMKTYAAWWLWARLGGWDGTLSP